MQSQDSSSGGKTQPEQPQAQKPAAHSAGKGQEAAAKNASTAGLPTQADDGDRIEKEWVAKVRDVFTKTVHDPYELNRQFTQIKADYMQKRYGKSVKVED